MCLKSAYKFAYKPEQDAYLRVIEIADSMHALIMGQSRRVPIVQMGLAEHALAIRTSVSLRRSSSPDADWNYAENLGMALWSWSRWK